MIINNPSISDSHWNHCVQWGLDYFKRHIFELIWFTGYPATNETTVLYCNKKLEGLHSKESSSVSTHYVMNTKKIFSTMAKIKTGY
jgi:hypothetical protein